MNKLIRDKKDIKVVTILFVVIILIIIRTVINYSNNLTLYVAGVDIIACVYVLTSIINKTILVFKEHTQSCSIPKQIINRETKLLKPFFYTILVSLMLVISLCCLFWFRSDCTNDIISFVVLGLSIIDHELAEMFGHKLCNMRCKK